MTHKALYALHERKYSAELKIPRGKLYRIEGKLMEPKFSNSKEQNSTLNYRHANLLGMDFILSSLMGIS